MERAGNTAGNKRKYCDHCGEYLTVPVFKRHKHEFCDPVKKEWQKKQKNYSNHADEINYENTIASTFTITNAFIKFCLFV